MGPNTANAHFACVRTTQISLCVVSLGMDHKQTASTLTLSHVTMWRCRALTIALHFDLQDLQHAKRFASWSSPWWTIDLNRARVGNYTVALSVGTWLTFMDAEALTVSWSPEDKGMNRCEYLAVTGIEGCPTSWEAAALCSNSNYVHCQNTLERAIQSPRAH